MYLKKIVIYCVRVVTGDYQVLKKKLFNKRNIKIVNGVLKWNVVTHGVKQERESHSYLQAEEAGGREDRQIRSCRMELWPWVQRTGH